MRTIKLCKGTGNGIDTACLMTAISIVNGTDTGDKPSCVCTVIRAFVIKINDYMPNDIRSELLTPLIWELSGTKSEDKEVIVARAKLFAKGAKRFAAVAAAEAAAEAAAIATKYAAAAATAAAATAATAADDAVAVAVAAAEAAAKYTATAAAATAATAANADAKTPQEIWQQCVDLIRQAASIGDKRPIELVYDENYLAEKLGTF